MRKHLTLAALSTTLFAAHLSIAQPSGVSGIYGPNNSIVVTEYGNTKTMAWAGGANSPQFTLGDLNNDKKKDLVIFEENAGVKTFINTGTTGSPAYVYDPQYEVNFPPDLYVYLKLEDYDRDGIPDLFHRGSPGISVFKGYYNSSNQLCFNFYRGLYYNLPGVGPVNAYVEPSDMPSILDYDGDGDLDFFAYGQGGYKVFFFRNCQVEDGLPKDSIRVCVKDVCWGRVSQNFTRQHNLGEICDPHEFGTTCKGCPNGSGNKGTHSGNSLTLVDYDGDGDYDFFDGNVSFPDAQLVKNGKKQYNWPIDSMVAQDTIWQGNGHPVNLNMFPSAFWIDIDQDGDKDLMFAPHALDVENHKNVFYYKNTGSDASPNFVYQSDSFIVDRMIDLGTGAHPVLYDYNKDGKLDLFVGSDGIFQPNGSLKSRIYYYQNTSHGTTTQFDLVDDDLLGLYSQGIKGAAPAIADIDNDGKDDLLIGLTDGTLMLFKNTAPSNTVQPQWSASGTLLKDDANATIDVGNYATPLVYDINKDGSKDLIIGTELGFLYYYKGATTAPGTTYFHKETNKLGGIQIAQYGQAYTHSAPFIGKIDNTGVEYLMIGTANGAIYRYDNFQNGNVTVPYTLLDSGYAKLQPGPWSSPVIADIDGDKKYEMLVGTKLGGVKLYKQYFDVNVDDISVALKEVKIYPNPANDMVNISWNASFAQAGNVDISVISATGQRVVSLQVHAKDGAAQLHTQQLMSGIYYCILQAENGKRSINALSIVK